MDKNKLIEVIEDGLGIELLDFLIEVDDPTTYIGPRFLPNRDIFDYDWKESVIDNSVALAKPLARGDAEAPLISGPATREAIGSVIGWGQKFQVNKKVLNKIFNPRNDNELKASLRQVLDESARNIRAAQMRREWLRWQFLAKGEIAIPEINLTIDMGVPGDNKISHTSALVTEEWDTTASATPIDDIVRMCEEYYTVNDEMPSAIVMRRAQVMQLLAADDTKDEKGLHSLAEVNAYLAGLGMGYPQIETYDEFVRLEDAQGRPTTKEYLIPAKRICLLKEATAAEMADIGRLMMGPVAENNFTPGVYATIYEETDPMKYWHFMATEMWPAQFNPGKVFFCDVVS